MDIFNVTPGFQLRLTRSQARSAALVDAVPCLDEQSRPGRIIFNVPCQIYASTVCIRVDQRNAAVFFPQETNTDIPVCLQGERIRLGSGSIPFPRHMVIGCGPKSPGFIVFFPLIKIIAIIFAYFVFIQTAKLRTGYLAAPVVGKLPDKSTLFQFLFAIAT